MGNNKKRVLLILILAVLYLAPILLLYISSRQRPPVSMVWQQQPLTTVTRLQESYTYPTDSLFEDSRRAEYTGGKLRLVVPRMGLDVTVGDGTDQETLALSPGLYDCAQLPSRGNPNVSIAGHRDIGGAPFYTIDQLQEGDMIELIYGGNRYRYSWEQTLIVPAEDWSVIRCRDYSAVTLTSCDPIGTTDRRIVAVGRLMEVLEEGEAVILNPA